MLHEELFLLRFRTMLAMDEPKFLVLGEMPGDPKAWGIVAGVPCLSTRIAWRRSASTLGMIR